MIIRAAAYPRAALMGNPSDGYFGRTISFCFTNFRAQITLYETPELEILPSARDGAKFAGIAQLAGEVGLYGYYGGIRLLKAAVKRFWDYCQEHDLQIDARNFTLRYASDIPDQVGLAGSSAIITACFRALMSFYGVTIPAPVLANLVLSVETQELGISAGLQDRVVQAYEGLVYMDFDRALMERQGFGLYEPLDPALLPPLYIAYMTELSEESGVFHNDLRSRFNRGEPAVVEAMQIWAGYAREARECLLRHDRQGLDRLIDANFDLRRRLCRLSPGNLRLADTARAVGATSKFTGSGGAIVGTYDGEEMYRKLSEAMAGLRARVFKPVVALPGRGA